MTILRIIFSILILSLGFLTMSQVFGQQVTTGQKPTEDIIITIDESGTAHVVHYVKGNIAAAIQVETIKGNMTNFSVTDSNGNSVEYFSIDKIPKSILFPPTSRNMSLIKYDLPNIVSFSGGIWKWAYLAPSDATFTDFYFPKGVDMIWVNNRPVYLGDQGLRQHGNGMSLEYLINEPMVLQNVRWEDKNFTVGIRTISDIGTYAFDQSKKAYAFDVNKANTHLTFIMPQELLWGPYTVTLNGNGTLYTIFHNNGTHVWIGITPPKIGTIQITGTTVVPEFPFFVPLVIGISIVIALQCRSRLNFK